MAASVYASGDLVVARYEHALVVVDGQLAVFHELHREAVEALDLLTDERVPVPRDPERAAAIREAVRVVGKYVIEGTGSTAPSPRSVDVGGRLLLRSHPAPASWTPRAPRDEEHAAVASVHGLLVRERGGGRVVLGDERVLAALAFHLDATGLAARRGLVTLAADGCRVTCREGTVTGEEVLVEIWYANGPSPEPTTIATLPPPATLARLLGASPERPTTAALEVLVRATEAARGHRVEFPDAEAFTVALERDIGGIP